MSFRARAPTVFGSVEDGSGSGGPGGVVAAPVQKAVISTVVQPAAFSLAAYEFVQILQTLGGDFSWPQSVLSSVLHLEPGGPGGAGGDASQ